MQLQEILQHLESKTGRRNHKSKNGYMACCPAHEDKNPSLSISEDSTGKVLIHCFSGCAPEAICKSLGIKISDLFNDLNQSPKKRTEYHYCDAQGRVLYRKIRIEPGKKKRKDFYAERYCDGKFIREITFSNNIRTFCRDAEHFRGRRDMALWNAWDNIIIFHEWTKNGLPNPAFKEKVGNFSGKNQIKYAFKAICRYLLTSLLAVKDDASASVSSINGNLPTMLSEQKPETFIITALELFIHPFECEIWLLLH